MDLECVVNILRRALMRSFFLSPAFSIMDIQDTSAAIYSEAKSEYTKQLIFNFQPVLLRFFLDRHAEAKAAPTVVSKAKSTLSEFQDSLSQIPEWNLDKVQRETTALLGLVHCDYIEDLITAVFIAHTKILSAIRLHAKPRRKINITVPKPEHFMHRALSECSRLLWSNVYLFSDSGSSLDRQKNTTDVNRFLEEGILQAIRNLLPVKSILRDSLQEDDDDAIHISGPPEAEADKKPIVDISGIEIDAGLVEPVATPVPIGGPVAMATPVPVDEPVAEPAILPVIDVSVVPMATPEPIAEPVAAPVASLVPVAPLVPQSEKSNTLVVDTEKSVGFTGVDSIFGDGGHAELRPMIEEGSDDFKILGGSEDIALDEFEDLDAPAANLPPTPLAVDDYETL